MPAFACISARCVHGRGDFEMREQQAMAWQSLPVEVAPVLPGTLPVLEWFATEQAFEGATHRG